MTTQIVKLSTPELMVIEKSKAEAITATFQPMAQMLSEFESAYEAVVKQASEGVTQEVTKKAKRLRLDIAKVRIATEKLRKEQKEEYLRAGKAIDGVSNILKWAVTDKESELKKIEDHFETLEKERLEALQRARVEKLSPYVEDANERDLSSMDDDVWLAYFNTKKQAHEDRVAAEKAAEEARIAAEKKAEEERIAREKAEAEEREKIRKENERLKAEAEEKERQRKLEEEKRVAAEKARQEKEAAERKAREEQARKEREAHEAALKKEREAREKAEREEREKREKLEAELKAKEEAERKAREEEEARIQAELNRGDEEKIVALVDELTEIKTKYKFKSKANKAIYREVVTQINVAIEAVEARKGVMA